MMCGLIGGAVSLEIGFEVSKPNPISGVFSLPLRDQDVRSQLFLLLCCTSWNSLKEQK